MSKSQVSLNDLTQAKKSIAGRLSRLKTTPDRYLSRSRKSPIAAIGVFESEIEVMESVLSTMKKRLDNAKITIEI